MPPTPSNPETGYVLDWETQAQRSVPAYPPPGWAGEYDPNVIHSDGWPQIRAARQDSPAPVRGGLYSARFDLERADPIPPGTGGKRCELSAGSDPVGAERWYGFSIYLTPQWWVYDQAAEAVTQWHQSYPITNPSFEGSPPLAIVTRQGNWEISVRERSWDNTISANTVAIWHGPYEQDRWADWVVHVKWSAGGDGLLQIWKDGNPLSLTDGIGDRSPGQNKFNDAKGNYMKIGIYKWPWNPNWTGVPSQVDKRVMYYDELRIADERGSYDAVAPRSRRGCLTRLLSLGNVLG